MPAGWVPDVEPIIPIARIEREAIAAARQHACINAACPYPFGSAAGRLFKQLYLAAQKNMTIPASSASTTGASSY